MAESFDGLSKADLAVCLAGFHHVLGSGSAGDRDSHHRQRLEALRLWRSRLAPSGRLVIADVPATGVQTGWADGPVGAFGLDLSLRPTASACNCALSAQTERSSNLNDYLQRMLALCGELRLQEPDPAAFFDRVVSVQSPYGHVACFDSPQELADLFREAGFEHVRAVVVPTPWLFPTKADAIWFVHELLGIGEPYSGPTEIPMHKQQAMEADIRDHLGLRQLPDGSWAVSWKLMYVMGDRP